jgi:hypothetical protein
VNRSFNRGSNLEPGNTNQNGEVDSEKGEYHNAEMCAQLGSKMPFVPIYFGSEGALKSSKAVYLVPCVGRVHPE